MQHVRRTALRARNTAVLAQGLAALALVASCSEQPAPVPEAAASLVDVPTVTRTPGPTPVSGGPDVPGAGDPASSAAGCEDALPLCQAGASSACTLTCEKADSGCLEIGEFVPLSVDRFSDSFRWNVLDPAGQYAVYEQQYSGASLDMLSFRWSADAALLPLDPELMLPEDLAPERDDDLQFAIAQVASGGDVLLAQRTADDYETRDFVLWSETSGPQRLDFEASEMTSDGRVVVGVRDGQAVRWTLATGTQLLLPGASVQANVHAGAQVVAFTDGTRLLLQDEIAGLSQIELGPTAARGAPVSVIELSEDGSSLVGSIGGPAPEANQLFSWTRARGVLWLDPVPGLPPNVRYSQIKLSADGRAIVGEATSVGVDVVFHWTAETGMQALQPDLALDPTYLSPSGDVVGGYHSVNGRATGFRWTQQSGMRQLEGLSWGGAFLGGNVFARANASGGLYAEKYDEALGVGELPIERLRERFMPEGWSGPGLQAIAENGRMLAGTARNPDGKSQAWLVRLNEVCAPTAGSDEQR